MRFIVIGITDHPQPFFPPEVLAVINGGSVFSGGRRHHDIVAPLLPEGAQWIDITVPLAKVFDQYRALDDGAAESAQQGGSNGDGAAESACQGGINGDGAAETTIVVFASGDPLFFGFANTLRREFPGAAMRVYPAFNSLQTLAHRLLMPYHAMRIVSLTGRPWQELDRALIERAPLIGILTDHDKTPAAIARRCLDYGFDAYRVFVGERLGNPELERISQLTLTEAADHDFTLPNCLILSRDHESSPRDARLPSGDHESSPRDARLPSGEHESSLRDGRLTSGDPVFNRRLSIYRDIRNEDDGERSVYRDIRNEDDGECSVYRDIRNEDDREPSVYRDIRNEDDREPSVYRDIRNEDDWKQSIYRDIRTESEQKQSRLTSGDGESDEKHGRLTSGDGLSDEKHGRPRSVDHPSGGKHARLTPGLGLARPFGLPDTSFALLDGREKMITKMPIRLLTLQALELPRASVFWDVGACTGSVSIEARLLFPHLRVVAFEIRPECEAIIRENCRRHGAPGIELVMGDFSTVSCDSVATNDRPDAVFIGGHGGRLREIMARVLTVLAPDGIIVMNSVTSAVVEKATQGRPTSRQLWEEACQELGLQQEPPLRIQLNDYNPIEILKAKRDHGNKEQTNL